MESIEQMIKRLCPEGVEWKKISEIGTIYRGVAFSKKDFTETGTPCIHYGQIYTKFGNSACKTLTYVSETLSKGKKLAKKGDLIMAVTSENMEDVGKCLAWLGEEEILVSNHACYIRHSLNPMYLAYYLQSSHFFKYKKKISKGVKVIDLDLNMFADYVIPVPPFEIQNRIVEVLDKMTTFTAELKAELEAELEARKQQYEYYRDKLLTFNEIGGGIRQVTWKKISEICMNCDNKRKPITSGKRVAGEYPYYGASGIVDYVEGYIFDGDYLLVSEDGANLLARNTPIAFSITGKNWVNNHAHVLQFETYAERKFVEYYLNMIDLSKYISGGAQPKLNQQSLNNILIPVPSMKEQERIVSILDRFEALTTDLQIGLPAEIEARRQQYEYYRNKLLTFDKIA